MKIKKLTFQNINSLYGKWEIDFECPNFVQSGLFAISGKTGSGKTTILDAMTLALYGTTPRLKKNTAEAVSKNCCEMMSEITFSAADSKVWVASFGYRRITQGANKGKMNDKAMHRLACDGVVVAENTTSVRKYVEEITGLDATRFCRAVLLAQGSFDAFLNAGSDNGEILERITGTEIYSRISATLKERFNAEKEKLALLEKFFEGIQVMPDEEAETVRLEAAELEKEIVRLGAEQRSLNQRLDLFRRLEEQQLALKKCSEAEERLNAEETAFAPARKRLEEGRELIEAEKLFRPCRELQQQQAVEETALQKTLQELKDQESICAENSKKLEAAKESSAALSQELEAFTRLLNTVKALDTTISAFCDAEKEAKNKRREQLQKALEYRRERAGAGEELAQLIRSNREAAAYLAAHAADGELEAVKKVCTEHLANARTCAASLAEQEAKGKNIGREFKKISADMTAKEELLKKSREKLALAAEELSHSESALALLLEGTSKEKWQLLADTQEKCWQQAVTLRSLDEHRRSLEPGKPCPLCGSTAHPFAEQVMPEPEKEQKELEQIRKRLADIAEEEKLFNSRKAALELSQASVRNVETLLEQLQLNAAAKEEELRANLEMQQQFRESALAITEKISTALAPFGIAFDGKSGALPDEVERRIAEYARLREVQNRFEQQKQLLESAVVQHRTAVRFALASSLSLRDQWIAEVKKLEEKRLERKELFGSGDTRQEEMKMEKKRQDAAELLAQAERSMASAATNRERTAETAGKLKKSTADRALEIISARSAFLNACAEAGVTEELFHARLLSQEEMTASTARDAELKARRVQLAETRKNGEAAVTALADALREGGTREETLEAAAKISQESQEKNRSLGAVREKIARDEEGKKRLAEKHAELTERKKSVELWTNMNNMIGSGDKFRRFAQGITLENLLALANQELARFNGRYRLLRHHSDELEIDVADQDQGDEIRSCRTLSGGERFLVSLALALGLSRMAGEKIRVDSLFLDEGFGTLDADTLDTALEALSSLRNRGKLVGIISHVAGLSEKIPCVIEVRKAGGGRSTLKGPGVTAC